MPELKVLVYLISSFMQTDYRYYHNDSNLTDHIYMSCLVLLYTYVHYSKVIELNQHTFT